MEKFSFNPKRPVGPNPNVFDPLKKDWSELEVVELFLTSNLIKEILTFTNRFGEDKLLNKSKAKKKTSWIPFTVAEFRLFIANLCYMGGLQKARNGRLLVNWLV